MARAWAGPCEVVARLGSQTPTGAETSHGLASGQAQSAMADLRKARADPAILVP